MASTEVVHLFEDSSKAATQRSKPTTKRANDLPGKEWTRYSISVWNDLRKTAEEAKLGHPAMFPGSLVERLIKCFTCESEKVVLDPFCGSGATLSAAMKLGKVGIGFEVARQYYDLAIRRLGQTQSDFFSPDGPQAQVHLCDAREIYKHVAENSVDICITSPPYWDILSRKRSADYKDVRDYAPSTGDLSKYSDYREFIEQLAVVFRQIKRALRPRHYCAVVVMDIRKQDKFFPFHSDLYQRLSQDDVGFALDDIIIWDRRHEYNNLRPLGYPSTFRINKIHEYILLFRKLS